MRTLVLGLGILLTGCSSMDITIPSFWDDNEAMRVIDVVVDIEEIDCTSPHSIIEMQLSSVAYDAHWLKTYATLKGSMDVVDLVEELEQTIDGMAQKDDIKRVYCEVKRGAMLEQSRRIAGAILGRF